MTPFEILVHLALLKPASFIPPRQIEPGEHRGPVGKKSIKNHCITPIPEIDLYASKTELGQMASAALLLTIG